MPTTKQTRKERKSSGIESLIASVQIHYQNIVLSSIWVYILCHKYVSVVLWNFKEYNHISSDTWSQKGNKKKWLKKILIKLLVVAEGLK